MMGKHNLGDDGETQPQGDRKTQTVGGWDTTPGR